MMGQYYFLGFHELTVIQTRIYLMERLQFQYEPNITEILEIAPKLKNNRNTRKFKIYRYQLQIKTITYIIFFTDWIYKIWNKIS